MAASTYSLKESGAAGTAAPSEAWHEGGRRLSSEAIGRRASTGSDTSSGFSTFRDSTSFEAGSPLPVSPLGELAFVARVLPEGGSAWQDDNEAQWQEQQVLRKLEQARWRTADIRSRWRGPSSDLIERNSPWQREAEARSESTGDAAGQAVMGEGVSWLSATSRSPPQRGPQVGNSPRQGDPRWQALDFGLSGTLHQRTLLRTPKGGEVSLWHDVPLSAGASGQLNCVCKTPRGSWAQLEVASDEFYTPLRLSSSSEGGQPAHYARNSRWNLGILAQTWASPQLDLDEWGGISCDGSPVETIDISTETAARGLVYAVKPLAAFVIFDSNMRLSWKVIVIACDDPLADELADLEDLEREEPGQLLLIKEWLRFRHCFKPGDRASLFGMNERPLGLPYVWRVVTESHAAWRLLTEEEPPQSPWLPLPKPISADVYTRIWAWYNRLHVDLVVCPEHSPLELMDEAGSSQWLQEDERASGAHVAADFVEARMPSGGKARSGGAEQDLRRGGRDDARPIAALHWRVDWEVEWEPEDVREDGSLVSPSGPAGKALGTLSPINEVSTSEYGSARSSSLSLGSLAKASQEDHFTNEWVSTAGLAPAESPTRVEEAGDEEQEQELALTGLHSGNSRDEALEASQASRGLGGLERGDLRYGVRGDRLVKGKRSGSPTPLEAASLEARASAATEDGYRSTTGVQFAPSFALDPSQNGADVQGEGAAGPLEPLEAALLIDSKHKRAPQSEGAISQWRTLPGLESPCQRAADAPHRSAKPREYEIEEVQEGGGAQAGSSELEVRNPAVPRPRAGGHLPNEAGGALHQPAPEVEGVQEPVGVGRRSGQRSLGSDTSPLPSPSLASTEGNGPDELADYQVGTHSLDAELEHGVPDGEEEDEEEELSARVLKLLELLQAETEDGQGTRSMSRGPSFSEKVKKILPFASDERKAAVAQEEETPVRIKFSLRSKLARLLGRTGSL